MEDSGDKISVKELWNGHGKDRGVHEIGKLGGVGFKTT